MTLPARPLPKTWVDLDEVPEGFIGEIVDGEVRVQPRPDPPHVNAASDLFGSLAGPFRFGHGGPGGWIIRDEPRIQFGDQIRVPDLSAWRAERFSSPRRGPFVVIPDWICEVHSPATALVDRTEKMPLYASHGVQHLWLLDPIGRTLEVLRLAGGHWLLVRSAGGDQKVRAEPFDAVELDLSILWTEGVGAAADDE